MWKHKSYNRRNVKISETIEGSTHKNKVLLTIKKKTDLFVKGGSYNRINTWKFLTLYFGEPLQPKHCLKSQVDNQIE